MPMRWLTYDTKVEKKRGLASSSVPAGTTTEWYALGDGRPGRECLVCVSPGPGGTVSLHVTASALDTVKNGAPLFEVAVDAADSTQHVRLPTNVSAFRVVATIADAQFEAAH